jgi:hypothetical protein
MKDNITIKAYEEFCNVLKNTHSTVSLGCGAYVSNIEDNSTDEVKFFNYGEMDDEASLEVISTGMTYEEMKKDGKLLHACLSNPMVNYSLQRNNGQSITVEKAQKVIDFFSGKSKTIPLTFNGLLAYYGKDFYKHYQMYKLLPTATTRKIFSNANIEMPEDVIKDF